MKTKRFLSILLTLCLILGMVPNAALAVGTNASLPFSDVKETDWFHDAVQYTYENQLMSGTGEETFSPHITATRGMIVTILHRMEGVPSAASVNYTDVPRDQWYTSAVDWASKNNIVNGYGNGKFGPNDPVTREQMATILHRYGQYKDYDSTINGDASTFSDGNLVSSYAIDAMNWAIGTGLFSGVGNNMLLPAGSATRAQVATLLTRFCNDVIPTVYTVTFEYNYSNKGVYETIDVEDGDTVDKPENPSRSGYSFIGWYTLSKNGEKFDFDTIISKDITLYARWSENSSSGSDTVNPTPSPDPEPTPNPSATYQVSFNLGIDGIVSETDTVAYAPQNVIEGNTAKQPVDPNPIIGDFAGWYTAEDYAVPFDFSTPITTDTTVYASWTFDTTDSDGDNLPDDVEDYLGLNPTTNDTDGDGLPDRVELEVATDPKTIDTDSDGITDYDEDYDGDGLTNGKEVALGTSPIYADTDLDGVNDGEEINVYHTDPNKEDTDGDGAKDGWEIENGFDPLTFNASFVVEEKSSPISEANPVSASVSLEIPGEQASSVEVTPMDTSDSPLISATIPGYLGQAYDFSTDADFESATLKFTYDTSLGTISDTFQPRIYYFNEADGTFEELPNQIVENGCVTVTVTHFSTYILLNKVEFDKVWEEEIRSPDDTSVGITGLDIVFVIDSSGSMSSNDRNGLRITAAKEFVSRLGEKDRAAVVDFDSSAKLLQGFTNDHELLNTAIEKINSSGGTNLSRGMNTAITQFTAESYTRTDAYKYIIFLTDGDGSYSDSYTTTAAENGIIVYTIGLGSGVDETVLTKIAEGTGGKYYFASTAEDVPNIYEDVSFETVDYTTDTNGDGISDYYTQLICEGKLRPSNGSSAFKNIDFNYGKDGSLSDDYDGDGLKNGEELVVYYNESTGRVYLTMLSDPTLVHSDNDGVDDYAEVRNGQNPLKEDYYKNSDVKKLLEDNNFYYEDYVAMFDDSTFYQMDSAFLGVITGLWNPEGLCRELMIEYFDQYGETTADIEEVSEEISDDIWLDNLDRLLGYVDKIYDGSTQLIKLKGDIKNLIDVVRGHSVSREVIAEMYFEIVRTLSVYIDDIPVLVIKETTIGKATVTALKKSPLDTFDTSGLKLSVAFDVVNGAIDIADTVTTMSKVHANYAILSQNIDFLYEMYEYGTRPVIRYAAEDLINSLGEGFEEVMVEAIGEDIGELTLNIAKSIASCNPYVGAVTFVIDMLNLFTGLSDTIEREYQMVCYNSMVDSLDWLISGASDYSGSYRYDSEDRLYRYLVHLAQIRILGENTYIDFYSHGANTWFNDEDAIAEYVNDNIDWIKETAKYLHLTLHNNL